ncbi:MAG: RHS repeat-associated core domain-containing protein [Treponema sp.]
MNKCLEPVCQHKSSDLDYSFQYKYASGYAHRTESADNMYYTYDENGSLTSERIDREATLDELRHDVELSDNIYSMDYGIALPNQPGVETASYSRTYIWNERGLLRSSVENGYVVSYRYGEDGQRAVKSSSAGETMYFNNMWQMSSTAMGMRQTKHIFIGGSRVATKNNWWHDGGTEYEKYNTYWYHADHLGSAQLVTDWRGEEYERIEYTPYGELWVEKVRHGFEGVAYRFTGKEMDSETGLYYYGARYMDPKYSRWLSTDPALGDYIPQAPTDDEAKKHNQSLPGMGGVFNTINCDLYHYAGNNPVKYVDPDGNEIDIEGSDTEKKALLNMINSLSEQTYKIDNNKLVKDGNNKNQYGSIQYSNAVNNLIDTGTTTIKIGNTYTDENGKEIPLPKTRSGDEMPGYTYGNMNQKIMNISITNKSSKIDPRGNGYAQVATPAEILMHEIAGHAEPMVFGRAGNAVTIENFIRSEIQGKVSGITFGFKYQKRMSDKKHISF